MPLVAGVPPAAGEPASSRRTGSHAWKYGVLDGAIGSGRAGRKSPHADPSAPRYAYGRLWGSSRKSANGPATARTASNTRSAITNFVGIPAITPPRAPA